MTYWVIRWKSATDAAYDGRLDGCFTRRRDAEAAMIDQLRAAADALAHGTGAAGVPTPDGRLYRGDLDDALLGRYVIEKIDPDSREK